MQFWDHVTSSLKGKAYEWLKAIAHGRTAHTGIGEHVWKSLWVTILPTVLLTGVTRKTLMSERDDLYQISATLCKGGQHYTVTSEQLLTERCFHLILERAWIPPTWSFLCVLEGLQEISATSKF